MIKKQTIICLAVALLATFALAATPSELSYQGYLTDSSGNPVADGSYSIVFTIYYAASGGNSKWTETQSVTAVDGDPEISPRYKIASTAFSFQAENAAVAQSVATGVVGTSEIDPSQVQRRVSGSAAAGQFIKAINEDGSVVTAADQVGDGDISGVTAGTGLAGGGTSGDVTLGIAADGVTSTEIADATIVDDDIDAGAEIDISKISGTAVNLYENQTISGHKTFDNLYISPTTRSISISHAAFTPENDEISYDRNDLYLFARYALVSSQRFRASVQLPDGAKVVSFEALVYDNEATRSVSVDLVRVTFSGPAAAMAYVATSSESTSPQLLTDSSISHDAIDNDNYYYTARVDLNPADGGETELRLYAVRIKYEIFRPLP